jgi:carbon storage regulator
VTRSNIRSGEPKDESPRIGDEVTVTILGIRGKQIRLGVIALMNVSVHRQEILERIQRDLAAQAPHPRNECPRRTRRAPISDTAINSMMRILRID